VVWQFWGRAAEASWTAKFEALFYFFCAFDLIPFEQAVLSANHGLDGSVSFCDFHSVARIE
jgi:hypothetical protein